MRSLFIKSSLLLALASTLPLLHAQARMAADANPSFDVATIKPSGPDAAAMMDLDVQGRYIKVKSATLRDLIAFVYGVHAKQIVTRLDWVDNDKFDITGVPDTQGEPSEDQWKAMFRKLLTERYKLAFHHEKAELPAFVLSAPKGAGKLVVNTTGNPLPNLNLHPGAGGVKLDVHNAKMADLCEFFQVLVLDRPVVDQTGLTGRYDFAFVFQPDPTIFHGRPPNVGPTDGDPAPSLFTAIQETGLKLERQKTMVDTLVVDHAEKPSEN